MWKSELMTEQIYRSIRKRRQTLRQKAFIKNIILPVKKLAGFGVLVEEWNGVLTYYGEPNLDQIREIITTRKNFGGNTFVDLFEKKREFYEERGYKDAFSAFQALMRNDLQENASEVLIYTEWPYLESRTTRQFLVKNYDRKIRLLKITLYPVEECDKLMSRENGSIIGKKFEEKPSLKYKITDLVEVMSDGESFMFCFSKSGILRMMKYDMMTSTLSKHHNICNLDGPVCCAGVIIRRSSTIYIDRLSGTYSPKHSNLTEFVTVLKKSFPNTEFVVKYSTQYLDDGTRYKDHPDHPDNTVS